MPVPRVTLTRRVPLPVPVEVFDALRTNRKPKS
jgi:hypothetical protein